MPATDVYPAEVRAAEVRAAEVCAAERGSAAPGWNGGLGVARHYLLIPKIAFSTCIAMEGFSLSRRVE